MFQIEDEMHAEQQEGEFNTFNEALKELKKRAIIPFGQYPNKCPCQNWETCCRNYEIVEYDTSTTPWEKISCEEVLKISFEGVKWLFKP